MKIKLILKFVIGVISISINEETKIEEPTGTTDKGSSNNVRQNKKNYVPIAKS